MMSFERMVSNLSHAWTLFRGRGARRRATAVNGLAAMLAIMTVGTLLSAPPALALMPLTGVQQVAAGNLYSCAVVSGGIQCWGNNDIGELGDGTHTQAPYPVVAVAGGSAAADVGAGNLHACAVVNGGIQCWGYGAYGRLGNGSTANSSIPTTAIAAGSGATAVAAGYEASCAAVDGGVRCWGGNNEGQLGNGTTTDSSAPVLTLADGSGATAVAAGGYHSCAVVGGGVQCWGRNSSGQLGNGNEIRSLYPVTAIVGGSGVTAVATGDYHTCAVVSGGLKCWGSNTYGQLGDGSHANSSTPVTIFAAGSGVTDVAAGAMHTCAVVSGGVKCWGYNESGQLGDGSTTASDVPVQAIAASSGASAVAAGGYHSCAVVGGGAQCWGHNNHGQLGDGTTAESSLPVVVMQANGFAAGSTPIVSADNAMPTIVTALSVTCPASGRLLVGGSGESTALSTNAGPAFIGLAFSISHSSLATDNNNVVQSSALAIFTGDANRDFLNVQRLDSCTPGAKYTYRLTAYRTTPDTSAASFVWNGRLTASAPLSPAGTGFAAGSTAIGSASNASPTIVSSLSVTCPDSGRILASGSGESAALSTNPGAAFIGLAYSIARDSVATDNTNVVQSSALAVFNGDANRDFLNVQRVDSCSPGTTYTYRLTVYRTTADTSSGSFVWNGRLTASEPQSLPGTGYAAGSTVIGSTSNAAPTIVSMLSVTCPASGSVLVSGAGESAALSTNPGAAFIGLAYSIARDSVATDNTNVVQSSALAVFNGDANRDFLNVQRVDSCTPAMTSTYRLTAYRTTADTSAGSFVWNGRLAAIALP